MNCMYYVNVPLVNNTGVVENMKINILYMHILLYIIKHLSVWVQKIKLKSCKYKVIVHKQVAKWVGDLFNHGIYHTGIHFKRIPYLDEKVPDQLDR